MKLFKTIHKNRPLIAICLILAGKGYANPAGKSTEDPGYTSSFQSAILFIDKIDRLEASAYWPNIKPELFLQNLKINIHDPLGLYQGRGTNFCGYGAFSYLLLQDDPLGYVRLLLQLYQEGKAIYRTTVFEPSASVKRAAGTLRFKGLLDIRPAEQMWYLSLADHFKGYLNIFNRRYDPGDEDSFWASVNYAKFNRMIRTMLHYKVDARGADILHPRVGDLYTYIIKKLSSGKVVLYINNRIIHKKNHAKLKVGIPTHFIVLQQITITDNVITLIYWDYGGRTLMQLSPAFLKKITFGISYCTKQEAYAK